MGADGWLGIGWPKEYGGQGRPPIDQFIFFDEVQRAGAPVPVRHRQHGRPDAHAVRHRRAEGARSCPASSRGELIFAIGYTEPEAGTDLASLRTRAVRDGDEYVINGNKIFTSGANQADYVWLAVPHRPRRAEAQGHLDHPRADRRRPASRVTPIVTVGGIATTATYYDDVRVPVANRVGEENDGLAHDHHPAQPRAGRARRARRPGPSPLRRRAWRGRRADRRRIDDARGCSSTWPAPTPGSRR